MMRFLAVALQILTLLAPSAEAGLFSRKKKPAIKYGVSREAQQKRTEKAVIQRQKNRDKQRQRNTAIERERAKSLEVRAKSATKE